jgi:hypothetical protein
MKTNYIDARKVVIINCALNVIKKNDLNNLNLKYNYTLCSIIIVVLYSKK